MFMFILGFLACMVLAIVKPAIFQWMQVKLLDFGRACLDALSKGPNDQS